jgi:hypothetical protein
MLVFGQKVVSLAQYSYRLSHLRQHGQQVSQRGVLVG